MVVDCNTSGHTLILEREDFTPLAYTSIGDIGSTSAMYTGSELAVVEFDDHNAFKMMTEMDESKKWMDGKGDDDKGKDDDEHENKVSQTFITVVKNRGQNQPPKHAWMEVLIRGNKFAQGSVEGFKVNMAEKAYISGYSPNLPLDVPG